jgi:hypothetical protein
MRNKIIILLVTAFYIGIFSCMNLTAMDIQENNPDKKNSGKLIRMDLLNPKAKDIKPPLRNIFTGRKIETIAGLEGSLGMKAGEEEVQSKEIDQEKDSYPDLKYLGYIASFDKKVALILYRDEVMAVGKGCVLPGGIEIIDISLDAITIKKSSGSDKMVIKLEGEEK